MKVALIHLDLNKNGTDKLPAFISSVFVRTNIKTAEYFKPNRDDVLALSESKFKKQFPRRAFPRSSRTTDNVLVQWINAIKPSTGEQRHKIPPYGRACVLADTVVCAKDKDGRHIETIVAIGDCVYVKCQQDKNNKLPSPDLVLKFSNRYLLRQFIVFTKQQIRKHRSETIKSIPWFTNNKQLKEIKDELEKNDSCFQAKVDDVDEETDKGNIKQSDIRNTPLVQIATKLPVGVADLLRRISKQTHVPMTKIITDCILSKYGDQLTD